MCWLYLICLCAYVYVKFASNMSLFSSPATLSRVKKVEMKCFVVVIVVQCEKECFKNALFSNLNNVNLNIYQIMVGYTIEGKALTSQ